jgi:flagella basal body P-ring formation protein FlgA
MQVLCLFGLWHSIAMSQGTSPQQTSASPLGGSQSALTAMTQQVISWLSKTHGMQEKSIALQALDPRLQVLGCNKPLNIDHPFSSRETVRVRCQEPVWQLYVQASLGGASTTANQAASTSSSNSANSQAAVRTVVVPKRFLQRGAVLQAEWLEVVQAPPGAVDISWLGTVADAQQSELVRDVPAGQPIKSSDIRKAILVRQGQTVMLSVGDKVGYQITVRAEALQDGRLGEQVKLKNSESGRQISGVVTGPNAAKGL